MKQESAQVAAHETSMEGNKDASETSMSKPASVVEYPVEVADLSSHLAMEMEKI